MASSCQTRMLGTLVLWVSTVLGGLLLVGRFSVESFFILSFLGLIIVMQLFAPIEQQPVWWRYVRVAAAVGFVVFGFILYQQIAAVL